MGCDLVHLCCAISTILNVKLIATISGTEIPTVLGVGANSWTRGEGRI